VTPRDPSRSTDGWAGAFVAEQHRRPWLPYQRAIGDLIGERLPGGGYAHPVVVVLLPRQCGKTTLLFDVAMGRCLTEPDYRVALTSQTGHATTERFGERITELAATPLAMSARVRRSQGTERITFRRGSYVKAFPPKDGALRGSSLDLVGVDEAQEPDETLGRQLDQTIVPVLQNRPRRQLVLVGTAGTSSSDWLRRYLELGAAAAAGVALVEYGFPLDADPLDPAVWHAHHPGLAAGLTDESALRSALQVMGPAGFAREYGNVWQVTTDRVIPAAAWTAQAAPLAQPGPGAPAFGVDVSVDRTVASIVSCWQDTAGRRLVELVDQVPPQLAARHLADLVARHRGSGWLDGTGPAATIAAELTGAGSAPSWLHVLAGRDVAAACALMLDGVLSGSVFHRAEPPMDSAAAGATRRPVGDAWVWGRRTSATDVSPWTAATMAVWGHSRRPAPALRPVAAAS
jgi:hypothetical protein